MESRYELLLRIAAGGMATVYLGRQKGQLGFWRLVAIKRSHPHLTGDPKFVQMTLDEAMLASRIRHPNVVSVLDVDRYDDELLLVLDYIEGASLQELMERVKPQLLPPEIAIRVVLDACNGLHAAHELKDESGTLLGLVHRDVSPHNILVGLDGVARLTDFGIAKFAKPDKATSIGVLKGKLRYMAPEYINAGTLDRRGDVFSIGVTLWGALTGKALFDGENPIEIMRSIVSGKRPQLRELVPELPADLEDLFQMALAIDPDARFATVQAFSNALNNVAQKHDLLVGPDRVAAHVEAAFGTMLSDRRKQVQLKLKPEDQLLSTLDEAFRLPSLSDGGTRSLTGLVAAQSVDAPPVRTVARTLDMAEHASSEHASSEHASDVVLAAPAPKRHALPLWPFALALLLGAGAAVAVVMSRKPASVVTSSTTTGSATSPLGASALAPSVAPTAAPEVSPSKPSASPSMRSPPSSVRPVIPTSKTVPSVDPNSTIAPNPFGPPRR